MEFLTTQKFPEDWTKVERKIVRVNSRHFAILGNRLFRRGANELLRRCLSEVEVPTILEACHNSTYGGGFFGQKVLRAGHFWPTLFKDSFDYKERCDAWQWFARNDLRMQMSLFISLFFVPFEKWRIDYVGDVHYHSSKVMAYNVVATEYLTKWAEANAVRTDKAAHAPAFMYENIISRFKMPKILVTERETRLLNSIIQEITDKFQIDYRETTTYLPQINGQTEKVNGILVSILCKTVLDSKRYWDVKLTAILWDYRTTYKVSIQATHFFYVWIAGYNLH